MNPPGSAKALMLGSLTRKNVNWRFPVFAWLDSLRPSDCRYSLVSGSSRMRPVSLRPRITMRPMRFSSSMLKVDAAAVPISGNWSCTSWPTTGPGRASQAVRPNPASSERNGDVRACFIVPFDRTAAPGFPGARRSGPQSMSEATSASLDRSPRMSVMCP